MADGVRAIGWTLNPDDRAALLVRFAPLYPQVVATHVTLDAEAPPERPLPTGRSGELVGQADDGVGVQALVVRIGETTDRPDGSTYHLTWSLGPGRRAVESNAVIAARGWASVDPPIPVRLEAKVFD